MNFDYNARLNRLRTLLTDGVSAVALVPGANMLYFTGLSFHLMQRPTIALITADTFAMIIPQLEAIKLDERPDLQTRAFIWSDSEGYQGAFEAAVDRLGLRGGILGVDGMTMRVTEWLTFSRIDPTMGVRGVERDLIAIRAIKSPEEIDAMRRAIAVSERALERLLPEIKAGVTEREIASRLSVLLKEEGGQGESFSPAVQFGANSALPHGLVGDRQLERGQLIIIDFGAVVDGYPADITRTFCLGEASAEIQRMFNTVLSANIAAKAAVRPGVPMGDVDKAARDLIAAAGYGAYFIHRTGHGLGLDIHEPIPQIAAGVTDVLQPGMTFTIEPGIYLPGVGGVRIEDNVVCTEDGVEVLTQFPRELVIPA